jgi:hypothetical protein
MSLLVAIRKPAAGIVAAVLLGVVISLNLVLPLVRAQTWSVVAVRVVVPLHLIHHLCNGSVARSPSWRRALRVSLALAVAWQFWSARDARPARLGDAYEEAARFVLAETRVRPAPTVLYIASLDTGVFMFFVRKHDPARQLVVLRADKLLTTSLMGR